MLIKMQSACSSSVIPAAKPVSVIRNDVFPFPMTLFRSPFFSPRHCLPLLLRIAPAARITTTRLEILHFNSTIIWFDTSSSNIAHSTRLRENVFGARVVIYVLCRVTSTHEAIVSSHSTYARIVLRTKQFARFRRM